MIQGDVSSPYTELVASGIDHIIVGGGDWWAGQFAECLVRDSALYCWLSTEYESTNGAFLIGQNLVLFDEDALVGFESLWADNALGEEAETVADTRGTGIDSSETPAFLEGVCLEDFFSDACYSALLELTQEENRDVLYIFVGVATFILLIFLLANGIARSGKTGLAPVAQLFVGGTGYLILRQSVFKGFLGLIVWVAAIASIFPDGPSTGFSQLPPLSDVLNGFVLIHFLLVFDAFMLSRRVANGHLLNKWTFFWNRLTPNYAELIRDGVKPLRFRSLMARLTIGKDEIEFRQGFRKQIANLRDVIAVETEPPAYLKVIGALSDVAASMSDHPMADRMENFFSNYICFVLDTEDKKGRKRRFPSSAGLPNSKNFGFSDRDMAFIVQTFAAENVPIVKRYEVGASVDNAEVKLQAETARTVSPRTDEIQTGANPSSQAAPEKKSKSNAVSMVVILLLVVFGIGALGQWLANGGASDLRMLTAEDPFVCQTYTAFYEGGASYQAIECQVLIEGIIISDVIANRGNCTVQNLDRGYTNFAQGVSYRRLRGMNPRFGDVVGIDACETFWGGTPLVELQIDTEEHGSWTYSWR